MKKIIRVAKKLRNVREENYNMYLALLSDKQKMLFLGMAYNLTSVDGEYSETEKQMLSSYCQEMQMEFKQDSIVNPVEEIIDSLCLECGVKEKKIVLFELIGLALVDKNYDSSERKLIQKLAEKFEVDADFLDESENVITEYITLQNKINNLVI